MKWLRSFTLALPLALPLAMIAPMIVAEPAWAGDDESKKTYDYGMRVSIELRMENGKIVKHRGEMRTMGADWRFEFDGEDHHHALVLAAEGKEGDKVIEVTLSYDRDGMAVIAPFTSDWKVRKRDTLWTEDGSLGIALTFYPTKFEIEDKSRKGKDQIDPGDGDDPLGGKLF